MKILFACLLLWCPLLVAAELRVDLGRGATVYTTGALLARAETREVVIADDAVFRRSMRYRAVPFAALLPGLDPRDTLQFVAADGFVADIPAALVLARHGAQAWLAIEDPAHPWPAPVVGKPGIGPFYLVWTDARASGIGAEQWPYQLVAIRRRPGTEERYPAILPDPALPADSPVRRGLAVFRRNCFVCHTLNGEGDAQLGPDLNLPHSPVEYLPEPLLRDFIRDPQSLHRWPQAKMRGFPDRRELSDADLDALLAYLRHMAGRKRAP